MNLRRLACLLLLVCLLGGTAHGESVTLYTASSFAGEDASATVYAELLQSFEAETGCTIVDRSSASSESWKQSVLSDFAAGNEPDLLFFFARSADSLPLLSRVVPIAEINRDYPDLRLPLSEALREADGRVYAIPVRPFWEGLLCNTELFERFGLPLPDTWDHLMEAIRGFREQGITPIALSLMDEPHYIAEMMILACATPREQRARPETFAEVPESWIRGMALLRELEQAGAFPASLLDVRGATALFRDGKAAMHVNGSWFTQQLTEEEMARTAVLPVPPLREGARVPAYIGGVSMGFYLTRRAYSQPDVRDSAVRLLAYLTREDSRNRLAGASLTGLLAETAAALIRPDSLMLSPIQDAMNAPAREAWLMECVPAVAEGRMTPEACWEKVMSLNPFH